MIKLYFIRLCLRIFYCFRINNKKVFFSSYEGSVISCNPKYIYKELFRQYGNNLEYIWELNDDKYKKDDTGIIFVKHNTLRYLYHIMTSKVIITNVGITSSIPLRKHQLSINTWHGAGCYKKEGVDLYKRNNSDYRKKCYFAGKNVTYYLSGCEAWTKVFSKAVLSDRKKFLPIGCPRNDMLINGVSTTTKESIKEKIGIKSNIVLYAPTYRGERDTPDQATCPLEVEKLLACLAKRFGGEWTFAYRCHYATASTFKNIDNSIDLSNYDDMQELLVVADVLISDYSSSVWDFSFTKNPCFLFCYDLNRYVSERNMYLPVRKWHFPVSENMEELLRQIENFSEKDFLEGMAKHHSELGSFEKGTATKNVVDLISKNFK